ncbi:TonB-dependent receptor [Fulvivirga ligni]|uniref:TonB-dependent receptor n=1 Tax=Fulvivirga ligni TaxID=2904246 RepID=UPI001F3AC75F|nr:TonB-dependent receptor [Fulvivirga ligni]UII22607.1 TonB-dependent receptor [Fulvivirga ligni]
MPFFLSNSAAPELYNSWSNSFGNYERTEIENNFSGALRYTNRFGEFDVSGFIGGNIRYNSYHRFVEQMPTDAKTGGLIIPDVYQFSNAGIVPTPSTYDYEKQVNSLYGNFSIGYRDFIYLDGSVRNDWSSALPASNNGYMYPSVGASFIFSELLDSDFISYGKLRGGWAQVGSDVDAILINQVYRTDAQPFNGSNVIMYNPTRAVSPTIEPAKNTSIETGFDLRMLDSRIGLNFTYYRETRKNDIIPVSVSQASGYYDYLTNAGETMRRGVEISLDADVIKSTSGFNWNVTVNFAKNKTTIEALPDNLTSIVAPGGTGSFGFVSMYHELGNEWGQLRGIGYATDDNGNKIIDPATGLYEVETNQFMGTVLPDFTGGIFTTLSYKGVRLAANFDFQKGGKFFSLSEQWGSYSGLLEETAATNDRGSNIRDDVSEGGGVRVTGVTASGEEFDEYVDAQAYYAQFIDSGLASPFVHNASYFKLREVSLSYDFGKLLNVGFIKGAQLSLIGRNLALIAVSKDNTHRWDPSELSQTYGENGQLPGTRSYGVNLKLTF